MPDVSFGQGHAFDPSSSDGSTNVLSVLASQANYAVLTNAADQWVVQLATPVQGAAFVVFFAPGGGSLIPQDGNLPPLGTVEQIVFQNVNHEWIIVFADLAGLGLNAQQMIGDPALVVSGGDSFTGSPESDLFHGGDGNDLLSPGTGDAPDTLFGDLGDDLINGGGGADILDGGAGDDVIYPIPDPFPDVIAGGPGFDRIDYFSSPVGVVVELSGHATAGGSLIATFTGIEAASGSPFDDELIGTNGDNRFTGWFGSDLLVGGGGDDWFVQDVTLGGSVDRIFGGTPSADAGFDTIDYSPVFEGVIIQLSGSATRANGTLLATFSGIEAAVGTVLNDALIGNAANNRFTALAGSDSIEGGAGIDISAYSIASTSASWVRHLDGSWTLTAGADGTDTLIGVEFLDFTDRDVFLDRAARTFSGDGASDIFWRNTNGQTVIWGMNGETVLGAGATSVQVGNVWSVQETGDFNGDGRDDILWRHTNGQTVIWQMNGGSVSQAGSTSVQVGAAWSVQGVGDFNLDGRDDIVWRNTSGLTVIWLMDGTNVAGGGATSAQVANAWHIAGIGDFNGDGRDDFVWRHDNGLTAIWQMDGTTLAGGGLTSLSAGLNWDIAGVGDFNGDGRDDLLWRSNTGLTAIWQMNGTSAQGVSVSVQVGNEWHIASVGDYNGDGKDDILWRNNSGLTVLWEMNGATLIDAHATSVQVGNDWGIV